MGYKYSGLKAEGNLESGMVYEFRKFVHAESLATAAPVIGSVVSEYLPEEAVIESMGYVTISQHRLYTCKARPLGAIFMETELGRGITLRRYLRFTTTSNLPKVGDSADWITSFPAYIKEFKCVYKAADYMVALVTAVDDHYKLLGG